MTQLSSPATQMTTMKVNLKVNLVTQVVVFLVASWSLAVYGGTGSDLYNEFTDSDGFYDDPSWQEYVNAIGQRLVEHSEDKGREYYFFVLDDPGLNAFATPDAYIFVNRGLLVYMQSEDQLAAVIGHEIGHVTARHGAKRRRSQLLNTGFSIAAQALTGRHEAGQAVREMFQTFISGYGREQELEADRIGAEIIAGAGYNPLAVIDAVRVLKDQEIFARKVQGQPPSYHGLFDTHPQNDKRLHEAVEIALPKMANVAAEPIADFWEMIDGLDFGVEEAIGLADNVFYDQYHRIVIEFPIGWRITLNQGEVLGQSPAGRDDARVRITKIPVSQDTTPETLVKEVLKRTDVVSASEITVNSDEVYLAELEITEDKVTSNLLAVHQHGYDYYLIRGIAGPNGSKDRLVGFIQEIVAGIRNLRSDDLQNKHIHKVKIVIAKPDVTYAELAKSSPIQRNAEDTLRLINGQYPNGEPRAGDRIKIIQ